MAPHDTDRATYLRAAELSRMLAQRAATPAAALERPSIRVGLGDLNAPPRSEAATVPAPDEVAWTLATPDDGLYLSSQSYLGYIHAPEAWDLETGDPAVTVAVIDSGIDVEHPDLAANIWYNSLAGATGCGDDRHGCNFLDPAQAAATCSATGPVQSPQVTPTSPHGTFVAGVIGAVGNNGIGISGVVWHASLMAVRVADCHGRAGSNAVANAVHYAVDAGARVINISVGVERWTPNGCRPPGRVLADAVQYARDRGVLVVAGAGNTNRGCVDDPAAAPGAVAVGGFSLPGGGRWTMGRTSSAGSNWGPEIAVAAPAAEIAGTVPRQPNQPPPSDLYATASGTSFAAPIVAGTAALLLSRNPLLTPDWLLTLITLGAHVQPAGGTPGWAGAGTVDIAASLRLTPAGFFGSVSVAGDAVPDGTLVEGYIGGTQCAQAAAFSEQDRTAYALFVPAAGMKPGCGAPGAIVELRVDGVTVAQAPWSAAAIPLDLDLPAATP